MSYKVNKVIYMLLGMVMGFFVGGGIIWWQINKEKNSDTEKKIELSDKINEKKEENVSVKKLSFKEKYKSQLKKYKIPATFIDSLKIDSTTLTIEQLIALYKDVTIDTSNNLSENNNIVISKDELLSTRMVKVAGQNLKNNEDAKLDSILIDQRNTPKKDQNVIRVEFWRSPINYKGYKFDDVKLVVFGLLEFNNLSIYRYRDDLFISYNKDFYFLDKNDDFKPFMTVKDHKLLKELSSL